MQSTHTSTITSPRRDLRRQEPRGRRRCAPGSGRFAPGCALACHSAKPVGRFLAERFPVLSPKCASQHGDSLPKLDSSEYPKSTSKDWTPSPRNPPEGSIFFIFPPFSKSLKEGLRDFAHDNHDFIHFSVDANKRRPTPVISGPALTQTPPQGVTYPFNARFPVTHRTPPSPITFFHPGTAQ